MLKGLLTKREWFFLIAQFVLWGLTWSFFDDHEVSFYLIFMVLFAFFLLGMNEQHSKDQE